MKMEWKDCRRLVLSGLLLYLAVHYWSVLAGLAEICIGASAPLILGFMLAYMVNIPMTFFERKLKLEQRFPKLGSGVKPLYVLLTLAAVGSASNTLGGEGGPLAVLVLAIIAAELGKLVSKKTPVDILVTPLVTILSGSLLAYVLAPPIGTAAAAVGQLIMWATDLQPFLMGMFVSVLVGVALTLPISSAAICAALGLTGLAGGAAVAGCCAQMVGFAVISFRENRWGGLVAQGLGTSMLQVPNIIKNPRIWIAPTLASAITGPLATCVFRLEMNGAPVSSGMGTCGLVRQIGVIDGWVNDVANGLKAAITPMDWVGLVLLCFVLPAVLSWVLNLGLRKLGWVKDGDMKLDV